MAKFYILLLLTFSLNGLTGCGNSECEKVRTLENPIYNKLLESEKSFVYWSDRKRKEYESEREVCREKLKFNKDTKEFELDELVCKKETGSLSESTIQRFERAENQYLTHFEEWRKIIQLYPDCFEPEKVIKANK